MGMLGAAAVIVTTLALGAPTAWAEDAPRVNLLTSAPSTIAVSSTVDNVKIRPEHIADGKLDSAWNSATGQIIGAWVAVRVPAGARIKQIKLTPGFAAVDKRHGDLFTKNARIKKLRLHHAGRAIKDVTLDPAKRGLQTIDVDVSGGDLRLEVIEAEPGSKKTWREACISELEVWGTLPAGTVAPAKKLKPAVRLGSLDALPTTKERALLVEVITEQGAWYSGSGLTNSTLYRASAAGLADIAAWTSREDKNHEGGSSDGCDLVDPKVGATLPKRLELSCRETSANVHNADIGKPEVSEEERTESLTWNGTRYE